MRSVGRRAVFPRVQVSSMAIVHTTYTAKIEMAVPCLVHCRNCGCRFVYERRFSGEGRADTVLPFGHGRTEWAAEKRARDDLGEMLSHADIHDPIPCPRCLHYQPYMFSQVGYARYDGMGCLCYSLIALGLAVLVGAIGYAAIWEAGPLALGLAATGGVVWVAGWLLLRRMHALVRQYDPNDGGVIHEASDERRRIAQARATPLPEYDARQAARVGRACQRPHPPGAGSGRPEPPVVEWWLPPAVFASGGTVTVLLPGGERFTARVPGGATPGDVVDASPASPPAEPLRLRLFEMRVHPQEVCRE
jgi:hypothetical protein